MTLSASDIQQIRTFISKRGFTELDLQLEIIDHVACRVEEYMNTQPNLKLREAIQLTHAEFGVMGFSVFEDAMRSTLQQRYLQLFKNTFISCFNWRLLPAIAAFVYVLALICSSTTHAEMLYNYTGVALLIVLVLNGLVNYSRYKAYRHMLTFKTGNAFLIISLVLVQVYNYGFIQFRLYQFLTPTGAGYVYGIVILLLMVTLYSVNKMQQHAIQHCKTLQEKYLLAAA
ncbi:hypothetical protein [Mucilaginibacter lacusdianchii]|uniref:hypothetical protein n=1 Tax=Mucilaginibacter lacusdianchii TaxID=2684211 RepID=UPI00131E2E34|nr:hypothetical protein [Mucilaginibacter sp. JXJ CY 39]